MGCVLWDKGIGKFASNPSVNFEELASIEFLNLSHNLLTDCLGISSLTSLQELNLNYNKIANLAGVEELINL